MTNIELTDQQVHAMRIAETEKYMRSLELQFHQEVGERRRLVGERLAGAESVYCVLTADVEDLLPEPLPGLRGA